MKIEDPAQGMQLLSGLIKLSRDQDTVSKDRMLLVGDAFTILVAGT